MALRQHTKECLRYGIANYTMGSQIANVIDAGTGTIYQAAEDCLANAVGNRDLGINLDTKFENNTALSDSSVDHWRIAVACGSYTAALDIENEQSS